MNANDPSSIAAATLIEHQRILVVGDECGLAGQVGRALQKGADVVQETSLMRALGLLASQTFHGLIVDEDLPSFTGLEFFRAARHIEPDAVRILVGSPIPKGLETQVPGLVDHWVSEKIDPELLARRLTRVFQARKRRAGLAG